jgi:hypothetical protein
MRNFDLWQTTEKPFYLIYSFPYEPYIMANKTQLPEFATKFDFGGKYYQFLNKNSDKLSFMFELGYCLDFKFLLIPKIYTAHYPHYDLEPWHSRSFENAVKQYGIFVKEMRIKYPHKELRNHYISPSNKCSTRTCSLTEEENEKKIELDPTLRASEKINVDLFLNSTTEYRNIYESDLPLKNKNRRKLVNNICLSENLVVQEEQTKRAFKNCPYAKNGILLLCKLIRWKYL